MNKDMTVTMGKKTYRKPQAETLQMEVASVIAASGEITGKGSDMGWADDGDGSGSAKQRGGFGNYGWDNE